MRISFGSLGGLGFRTGERSSFGVFSPASQESVAGGYCFFKHYCRKSIDRRRMI